MAYTSRSLTKAEQNYAQLEKECVGIVFACERFHQYIYGQELECETDHKLLVSVINKKILSDCPLRIQRLLLRLYKYDIRLLYTPGKFMYTFDALSRAYLKTPVDPQTSGEAELNVYKDKFISALRENPKNSASNRNG